MSKLRNSTPPQHKHSKLTKSQKILLGILFPCSILFASGGGVGIGWYIWHSKKAPTKSINASIEGTCQVNDANQKAKITVEGYNGVNLNDLSEPTFVGLHFGTWGSDGADKKIIEVNWDSSTQSPISAGDAQITINCDDVSTKCQIVVKDATPTPSISASVTGDLISVATITVTLFNGANWSNVTATCDGNNWGTKSTAQGTYTFTKTEADATNGETVTLKLSGADACILTIPSGYTLYLPVTTTFYDINPDGVVQGFSTTFLNESTSETNARAYIISHTTNDDSTNEFCMDLSGKKIIGTQYAFSPMKDNTGANPNANINNIFACFTQLDFSNTQWQWDSNNSGNCTFGGDSTTYCNFANVKTLDLTGANFAVNNGKPSGGAVHTAKNTFTNATFATLTSLNLACAIFAISGMTTNADIFTASNTFSNATFATLPSLNLTNTVFAVSGMTDGDVDCVTASNTFSNATFTALRALNLAGVVFAISGMMNGGRGIVYTASNTFSNGKFNKLENLNFGNCELGNDASGKNTINNNCFNDLTKGWNVTKKLRLKGAYDWGTNQSAQLDSWFGNTDSTHWWTFTLG